MSSNLNNATVLSQLPPNLVGLPRVDLVKNDFDGIVWLKGYTVTVERALKCPCRNTPTAAALSSCRNCGGNGWVFYNKILTRMLLQSMNLDTKFKEWSEEKMGTVKITALTELELSYMDKITLQDTETINTQVLYPKDYNDGIGTPSIRAKTIYDMNSVVDLFLFTDSDQPLTRLQEGVHFTVNAQQRNIIEFDSSFSQYENMTISIRYRSNPVFHVLELMREAMSTTIVDKTTGGDQVVHMPIHAMGRRAHYVLDEENSAGTYLFDNSYASPCAIRLSTPDTPLHPFIQSAIDEQIVVGWTDPSTAEDNFIVHRRVGETGPFVQVAILPADTTSYTDTDVVPGVKYYYRIAIIEDSKQSPWSIVVGAMLVNVPLAVITLNGSPFLQVGGGSITDVTLANTIAEPITDITVTGEDIVINDENYDIYVDDTLDQSVSIPVKSTQIINISPL